MTHEQGTKDYLWLNLRDLPYFRAFLRAVEARFYQDFKMDEPVLDMGCGDGQFVTTAFDLPLGVGLDPWTGPVLQAAKLGGYRLVVQGSGNYIPFDDNHFASVISNSVLEHIPDVDGVLLEIGRVLRSGGLFLFCVPNHNFLPNLSVSAFLDRIGLHGLADSYRTFFNRISRHQHCDRPEVWQTRLETAGFRIERWWHYFSPEALHVLEWGHYFGFPSLLAHWIFKRWILVPAPWNLWLTRAVVQPFYDEAPEQPKGSYTFYVARKV